MQSWHLIEGHKKLYLEGSCPTKLNDVEVLDYFDIVPKDCQWIKQKQPKKANRFWFKAQTIYHAINEKPSRYVCWIDADVQALDNCVIDTNLEGYLFSAMQFLNSGFGAKIGIESGLMVFDTEHELIDKFSNEFISYWETGKVFELIRPYDALVMDEMASKYGFKNMTFDNSIKAYAGEDSFKYTQYKGKLFHYIGKHNKAKIQDDIT